MSEFAQKNFRHLNFFGKIYERTTRNRSFASTADKLMRLKLNAAIAALNTIIMIQHIHSGYQAPSKAGARLAIAPAQMQCPKS